MATAQARAGARPLLRDRPEWWIYAGAGGAWIALFATAGAPPGHHPTAPSWGAAFGSWTLMVVAMMAPFAAPRARAAERGGLWRLRRRSPLLYVAGFVAPWTAFAAGAATLQVVHTDHLEPA
ncbi:MAG: DUF2182 domain-containing protein, partial [Actinomycetota bacterium]|nr:DUF2182 domain-containing protein [Actinomycetota bacterium]